jgi:dTDP-4-dehydrorhamnose reductase
MSYLIFGGKGQLGSKFVEIFTHKGEKFSTYDYDTCDITDINSVLKVVKNDKPKIILNCAAYNLVDDAEQDSSQAYRVNQLGTRNVAIAARETGSFLVHYSTDYVFDGNKGETYTETDGTNPVNQYGMSKLKGEDAVLEILDDYLIFRLSWVYGNGSQNFIHKFTQWASKNSELNITENEFSIPTSVNLITDLTLKSLKKKLAGLFHLTPNDMASRLDWANEIVKLKNFEVKLNPVPIEFFNLPAKRPYNSAMSNQKISSLIRDIPDWKHDLKTFLGE